MSDHSTRRSVTTASHLASLLSEAAQQWAAEGSVEDTLLAIAFSAVDTIPGADYAGVSLIRSPHTITTPAATDDLVREADAVQSLMGEGPCVDALFDQHTVRVDDLAHDSRWPTFGPNAVGLGVASMLAFRLSTGGDSWGALNLYSRERNAFDEESEFVGLLFASHASIAMAGSQQLQEVTGALNAAVTVGTAVGILMERHNISRDDARAKLINASERGAVDIAAVAAQVITG